MRLARRDDVLNVGLPALACSAVPVLTISTLLSWGLPPSCWFLLRLSLPLRPPDHSLQACAVAPKLVCPEGWTDYLQHEAVARAERREPWRGVWRGDFVPASRRRRAQRLSGAARSDLGGYRVKGDVSRVGASSFLMQAPLRAFPGYRAFMRASRPIVARCGPRGVRALAPPSSPAAITLPAENARTPARSERRSVVRARNSRAIPQALFECLPTAFCLRWLASRRIRPPKTAVGVVVPLRRPIRTLPSERATLCFLQPFFPHNGPISNVRHGSPVTPIRE